MASGSFDITIDSTQIDSTLTNFPVMVYLSSSSGTGSFDATQIFTDLGANSKKIKVKNSSGNQLYCEIEMWDDTTEKAVLHVKVDSIFSSADTELTLEWDSTWADNTTYIGETGDSAAESVWDSNFVAVYHMNQDPSGGTGCILDSTDNSNDGTPAGSMTSDDLVDADYGKAIEFDGVDDYINIGAPGSLDFSGSAQSFCIEAVAKTDKDHSDGTIIGKWEGLNKQYQYVLKFESDDNSLKTAIYDNDFQISTSAANAFPKDTYKYLTLNADGGVLSSLVDGAVSLGTTATYGAIYSATSSVKIGVSLTTTSTPEWFDGHIREIRVSSVARSTAWIKATNASLTDGLVSLATGTGPVYGAEVATSAATEVNSRSAILQGSLTNLGGEASLEVYFEYGTTTSYGSTTDALTMTATGNFCARVTDLTEETTYHFRAVSLVGETEYPGADQTLTTLECPFQLTATPAITSILWDWLDMSGSSAPDGWSGGFITVGPNAVDYDYDNLREAVEVAIDGDIILCYGTFDGELSRVGISVPKTIYIRGMGNTPEDTIAYNNGSKTDSFYGADNHNIVVGSGSYIFIENITLLRTGSYWLSNIMFLPNAGAFCNKVHCNASGVDHSEGVRGTSSVISTNSPTQDILLRNTKISRSSDGNHHMYLYRNNLLLEKVEYNGTLTTTYMSGSFVDPDYVTTPTDQYGYNYGELTIVTDEFLASHGYTRVTP
jgi:hypothetical protein